MSGAPASTCAGLRGDRAEAERTGARSLPAQPRGGNEAVQPPPLLLAETWDGKLDPAGWLLSEKLDGVRAYWTGSVFLSRQGHRYHAPAWFTRGLPAVPLDGELWLGRKAFQRTVSIVRRQDESELWREVRYRVFDAPAAGGGFEERLRYLDACLAERRPAYAEMHAHAVCRGAAHLREELARVEAGGGEGLMLRQPGSPYAAGRSPTLLKVKSFRGGEALVVGHQPGRGRHKGRLGALLVELPDGTPFAVGTGLSDADRDDPPPVGSTVAFRYQELSDGGVPRFPVYAGVRGDIPTVVERGATMSSPVSRRFEFVEGTSCKFWEVAVSGCAVTVRYGRIGSAGQTQAKDFLDPAAAERHADKLVREKTAKGYRQVGEQRAA